MGKPRKVTSQPNKGKTKKASTKKHIQSAIKKISFNERFFRALIEHNSNAITLLNSEGVVIYDSPAANGMLGYSPTEWIGKSVFEIIHPDELENVKALFINLLQTPQKVVQATFRLRHKNNTWVWIEARATNFLGQKDINAIVVNYQDITERQQIEEALASSEKNFRSLIENSSDWFIKIDSQGVIHYVSDPITRNLGYTIEEFINKNIFDFIHPEDIPITQSLFAQLLQNPTQMVSAEYRLKHKDNSWRWVESVGKNLFDDPGIRAVIGNFRDITERKRDQAATLESDARYHRVLDTMMEGCQIIDFDWRYLYVNDAVAMGQAHLKPEEMINRTVMELYPGVEGTELFANLRQCMEERVSLRLETPFIFPDGRLGWFELSINPVQEGIFVLSSDISERKNAEGKIRQQNQRLQVLREIDTAILAADSVENIVRAALQHIRELVNCQRASLALIDWEAGEGLIFNVNARNESVLPKGTRVPLSLLQEMNETLSKNQPVLINDLTAIPNPPPLFQTGIQEGLRSVCVLPLFSQNKLIGAFNLSSEIVDFFDEEKINLAREVANQVTIAITQNGLINELQELNAKLEQRVEERTAELNQTNIKLEHANHTKDEFLANMSHELRTPLNSILGLSEYLLEQYQDTLNDTQQKSLQIIEASGRHLLDLINDILDLSKMQAGKFDYYPQLVNVNDLCKSSIIFVKSQAAKKSIDLRFMIEENISDFYADPRRLKQILINLLTNAVKFTPNEGMVTLNVNTNAEKNMIQFSVIDTGIGIAPEDLKRLFQPFIQVDSSLNRQFEGTGLGLVLVQTLTELHGGSIEVESEINKGSRFTVNLPYQLENNEPLVIEKSFALNKDEKETPAIQNDDKKKVLLVEDNETNILTISEYLENYGYQIIIANDGLQAIEKANENKPDIILMDIQMPVLDGLETMRRLRADPQFVSVPIIALTALAMPGDRERCLEAGASEYMSKPVSLKELRSVIENFLQ